MLFFNSLIFRGVEGRERARLAGRIRGDLGITVRLSILSDQKRFLYRRHPERLEERRLEGLHSKVLKTKVLNRQDGQAHPLQEIGI